MSTVFSSGANLSASAVFEARFGDRPGGEDAKTECHKWEQLCANLLKEREMLLAELDKARLERTCAEWEPIGSMEEVYAQVDRSTSLRDIVAQMEKELEAEK